MDSKAWNNIDFVKFLGLENNLTPLEIEDLTDSLNREVMYRALKDNPDKPSEEVVVNCANIVKKEFIITYLKDLPEQKIIKTVIENLESPEPDFNYCESELASFWANGRRTAPA